MKIWISSYNSSFGLDFLGKLFFISTGAWNQNLCHLIQKKWGPKHQKNKKLE